MSADTVYPPPAAPGAASEKSDAPTAAARISGALRMKHGMSLRAWVRRWARANGRDPSATYESARSALARNLDCDTEPGGIVGASIVEALRAELGPAIVPRPAKSRTKAPRSAARRPRGRG